MNCVSDLKLIISNEAILLAPPKSRHGPFFDNVALIVNCNLASPPPYTVTARKVICHPIHTMSRAKGASDSVLYSINDAIWEGLQTGNVVVHCLAGVHRAACVVVSHALYRHYRLRHTYISNDISALYSKLASIRRGVAPLGYLALVTSFRDSLEKQASEVGSVKEAEERKESTDLTDSPLTAEEADRASMEHGSRGSVLEVVEIEKRSPEIEPMAT